MVMSGSTHTYIMGTFSLLDILVEEGIGSTSESDVVVGCYCVEGPTKKAFLINLSHRFVMNAVSVLLLVFVGLFLFLHFPLVFGGWWSVVLASRVWCNGPRIFSNPQSLAETASQSPNDLMPNMDVKHKTLEKKPKTNSPIRTTTRKTNMSPENQWLEDVFPIEIVPF